MLNKAKDIHPSDNSRLNRTAVHIVLMLARIGVVCRQFLNKENIHLCAQ